MPLAEPLVHHHPERRATARVDSPFHLPSMVPKSSLRRRASRRYNYTGRRYSSSQRRFSIVQLRSQRRHSTEPANLELPAATIRRLQPGALL
jgi:hypothetical protein